MTDAPPGLRTLAPFASNGVDGYPNLVRENAVSDTGCYAARAIIGIRIG